MEAKKARKARLLKALVKGRIKEGRFTIRFDVETGAMLAAIANEAGLRGKAGIATVMEQLIQSLAESATEPASRSGSPAGANGGAEV